MDTNQRAEAMLEPVRYFYRAITGKPGRRVAHLPAHDVLPYENRSPHAEISEDRAVALWRFVTGDADLLIAPVQAAVWRMRDREFYSQLARTIARDESIAHEDLIEFLSSAGYDKQVTCEMPGQYAVRGGIIDIYSPESPQPVRVELLGDTIESIRAFDPNTQRSTNPVERATLLPLTEFPRHAEVLERVRVQSVSGREDDSTPAGFYPGWEFREALREDRKSTLFDLAVEPLIIEDEPGSLVQTVEKYRAQLAEAFDEAEDPLAEPWHKFIFDDEEWNLALQMAPRFAIEHLAIGDAPAIASEGKADSRIEIGDTNLTAAAAQRAPSAGLGNVLPQFGAGATELRILQTQPTTRYHGNVAAFIAEARTRIAAGENVMVSAASTGELERFADICHEFELPYRMGELEENATVARLAEEGSNAPGLAILLTKAPLAEGVIFPEAKVVLYGNADLFETLPPPSQRSRARPKTASFFSDFSDLKPGDYVVHVDHGIGQFEGLRQVATEGANGEFMLLRYAGDARLYVPLARLDLIQKYTSLGGVEPQLDRLGTTVWEARKTRVKKSVSDMAEQLLALYAERKMATGHAFPPDTNWTHEFDDAFEFEETPDQQRAIEDVKRDMESSLPMDRLLCGDVGYGKTEVAMRAAFKAIADSKQVTVLAPTTVLAFQHYQTFKRAVRSVPGTRGNDQPVPHRKRTEEGSGGIGGRKSGCVDRDAPHFIEGRKVSGSWAPRRRRRTTLRRSPQGTPQGNAQECRRAHDVRDPDSAHPAHVASGSAGHERDRDSAQGSPGHSDHSCSVQRNVGSASHTGRIGARWPGVLRTQSSGIHSVAGVHGETPGTESASSSRPRTDAGNRAGKSNAAIYPQRSGCPGLNHDHRKRLRHSTRKYHHHQSRRSHGACPSYTSFAAALGVPTSARMHICWCRRIPRLRPSRASGWQH